MSFANLVNSLASLEATQLRENTHKEEIMIRESGATLRRKMELDAKLVQQRRFDASKTFHAFLSNFFEGRRDKARYRAHKRSIKQSAKEQRRAIAMQRGYW